MNSGSSVRGRRAAGLVGLIAVLCCSGGTFGAAPSARGDRFYTFLQAKEDLLVQEWRLSARPLRLGKQREVRLRDLLRPLPPHTRRAHSAYTLRASLSPSGRWLAFNALIFEDQLSSMGVLSVPTLRPVFQIADFSTAGVHLWRPGDEFCYARRVQDNARGPHPSVCHSYSMRPPRWASSERRLSRKPSIGPEPFLSLEPEGIPGTVRVRAGRRLYQWGYRRHTIAYDGYPTWDQELEGVGGAVSRDGSRIVARVADRARPQGRLILLRREHGWAEEILPEARYTWRVLFWKHWLVLGVHEASGQLKLRFVSLQDLAQSVEVVGDTFAAEGVAAPLRPPVPRRVVGNGGEPPGTRPVWE